MSFYRNYIPTGGHPITKLQVNWDGLTQEVKEKLILTIDRQGYKNKNNISDLGYFRYCKNEELFGVYDKSEELEEISFEDFVDMFYLKTIEEKEKELELCKFNSIKKWYKELEDEA